MGQLVQVWSMREVTLFTFLIKARGPVFRLCHNTWIVLYLDWLTRDGIFSVGYSKRIGHYTIKALLKKCDIVVISVEMYGIVVISVQLANLKDEPTRQGNKISVSMKVLIMVSNKLHPSMTHQKALTYINIAKLRHLRLTVTSQGASLYESSEEPPSCSHRCDQIVDFTYIDIDSCTTCGHHFCTVFLAIILRIFLDYLLVIPCDTFR